MTLREWRIKHEFVKFSTKAWDDYIYILRNTFGAWDFSYASTNSRSKLSYRVWSESIHTYVHVKYVEWRY
jgi:hypothetical protein